jgi:hemolysin-activating ACP:hemolysin acyltransferase
VRKLSKCEYGGGRGGERRGAQTLVGLLLCILRLLLSCCDYCLWPAYCMQSALFTSLVCRQCHLFQASEQPIIHILWLFRWHSLEILLSESEVTR